MKEHIQLVQLAILAKVPVILWGRPGEGKTSTVAAIAKSMGYHLEVLLGSLRDRTDIGGFPVVEDGEIQLKPMGWVRRLQQAPKSILFLDELTTVPPDVAPTMLRIIQERIVGEELLPEGCSVVAAANPPQLSATGFDLSPPTANRLMHLEWKLPLEDYLQGMRQGFKVELNPLDPQQIEAQLPSANAIVAAYLERQPSLLHKMPSEAEELGKAWASPRSWSMAARMMAACMAAKAKPGLMSMAIDGCVGRGQGAGVVAFLTKMNLPTPAEVLLDPLCSLPTESDALFVVGHSAATFLLERYQEELWNGFWRLVNRYQSLGKVDLIAPAISRILRDYQKRPPTKRFGFDADLVQKLKPWLDELKGYNEALG